MRQNTPGGSLWYIRLAYERMLLDQLQMMVDPDARAAFHRQMQNRKRDYGQELWWAPGETARVAGPTLGRRSASKEPGQYLPKSAKRKAE